MKKDKKINPARAGQAEALARIHEREISEGFLSSLGKPFLTLLYAELIAAPDTVCFCVESENQVVGFACACEKTSNFYKRFLRKRFFPAAVTLLPQAVRPSMLKGILQTLARVRDSSGQELPDAEILSVAVEAAFQGEGLGQELVRAIAADFRCRDIQEIQVTAGASLNPANTFYRKLGFTLDREITIHAGVKSNIYVAKTEQLQAGRCDLSE